MRHACCTALSFRCLPLHEYRLVSLTHVGTAFDIVADAAIAPLQLCSRPSNWGIIPAPALHAVDLTFVEHLHHPRASGILLLQKARRAAERRAQSAGLACMKNSFGAISPSGSAPVDVPVIFCFGGRGVPGGWWWW